MVLGLNGEQTKESWKLQFQCSIYRKRKEGVCYGLFNKRYQVVTYFTILVPLPPSTIREILLTTLYSGKVRVHLIQRCFSHWRYSSQKSLYFTTGSTRNTFGSSFPRFQSITNGHCWMRIFVIFVFYWEHYYMPSVHCFMDICVHF